MGARRSHSRPRAGRVACLMAWLAAWCAPALALAAEAQDKAAPLAEADLGGAVVKMLMALALVLAVVVGLYWLARRFMPGQGGVAAGPGGPRLLGRLALGPKKGLVLVEVGRRVLVLGLAEQGVNLLASIDDPEEVAALTKGRNGFAGALRRAAAEQPAEETRP